MIQRQTLAAALLVALIATPAMAQSKKAAPATAAASKASSGELFPQAQFDLILKERLAQGQPDSPELRAALRDELINRELFIRAAKAKGLDRDATVKTQMQVASDSTLIRNYINDYLNANPVSDDQLKKEYDSIKAGLGDKEYRARHILVEKKEDAEALIKQLQGGAKFADLAKANSKDPGSKDNGGVYENITPGQFVPEFDKAMFEDLQPGETTKEPVKTQFGYHVIRLISRGEGPAMTEEQAKQAIEQQIAQQLQQDRGQALQKLLEDERAKAKTEGRLEEPTYPEPTPEPPPPAQAAPTEAATAQP